MSSIGSSSSSGTSSISSPISLSTVTLINTSPHTDTSSQITTVTASSLHSDTSSTSNPTVASSTVNTVTVPSTLSHTDTSFPSTSSSAIVTNTQTGSTSLSSSTSNTGSTTTVSVHTVTSQSVTSSYATGTSATVSNQPSSSMHTDTSSSMSSSVTTTGQTVTSATTSFSGSSASITTQTTATAVSNSLHTDTSTQITSSVSTSGTSYSVSSSTIATATITVISSTAATVSSVTGTTTIATVISSTAVTVSSVTGTTTVATVISSTAVTVSSVTGTTTIATVISSTAVTSSSVTGTTTVATVISSTAVTGSSVTVTTTVATSQTSTISSLISIASVSSVTTTRQTLASTLTITSVTTTSATVQSSQTASANTASTSSLTTTTTPAPTSLIYTDIIDLTGNTIDPNNATSIALFQSKLTQIINLAFQCRANPTAAACGTTGRRKRQATTTCLNYTVNIINIIQTSTSGGSKYYRIFYTVTDNCNPTVPVTAATVKSAAATLSTTTISSILTFPIVGDFVQSTSLLTSTTAPGSDQKLWLIGAILGPILFVILLIFAFCYLHYKCRPRGSTGRSLAAAVYNAPQPSGRATNYQSIANEPLKPTATPVSSARVFGDGTSSQPFTPIPLQASPTTMSQYPASNDIPMQEIRRQNDVERWRNKLRLQEKFEQRYGDPLTDLDRLQGSPAPRVVTPTTNRSVRSGPYQYDNRAFAPNTTDVFVHLPSEHPPDGIQFYEQPDSVSSQRRIPPPAEIEAGRTKLHRLLDEVLDKADTDESRNPDSISEQQRRRRQRRRANSLSYENGTTPIHHTPVVAQVTDRPDPSFSHLRFNPYEAGDRAHDIERFMPVELRQKYDQDDIDIGPQQYISSPYRSNPPLFYDDTALADRAATGTDAFGNPKRMARTRLETDREAMMRHDDGRAGHRQHTFNDDAVYIDTIPKNRDGTRVQARTAWADPNTAEDQRPFHLNVSDLDGADNDDSSRRHDYRDEYIMAKRSVMSTKNLISSIQGELQHIVDYPPSDSYHV